MNEYMILYGFALVAVIFAVIQDIRTREISNWVTFSLIAFVLAYRAFYSVYLNDIMFFVYGLIGVAIFMVLGHLFYYSRIFAGGDAKLLFGLGGIFHYNGWIDYVYFGLGFILILFAIGAVYTLIYSVFLVKLNYRSFKKSFFENMSKIKYSFLVSLTLGIVFYFNSDFGSIWNLVVFVLITLSPSLFGYVKAVESSCMISLVSPEKLTEGDWLERDIVINGKKIRKNFSGLSYEEILILRKAKKKVWIKKGVPFAPAFLITLILFLWYSSL